MNTNKLLGEEGFFGIKTGTTVAAGPCLASWFRKDEKNLIVVVLKCATEELRWAETRMLTIWAKTVKNGSA
jgi:D-alanyl-D-alanine carboxypeptidase